MYSHLPKEIYVLAFGKIMTSMGALIWPMLTLIMSEKLGLNGQTIGLYMMIFSLFMGPFYLLGGKLADKYNKKHIIVTFDLIGNSLYFVCAALPMSMTTLYLLAIALFQSMEQPAYDALIADLTTYKDRERAYSLNYLAMNLGLVMAPTIGGMLFNDYLNLSFFINGLADISSTLMLLFCIKNVKTAVQDNKTWNEYEKGETGSIFKIFSQRKLLFLLFVISGIAALIYNQYNFLMPLHMEEVFRGSGAFRFGVLTSINAVVGMIIFTIGEIFGSISKTPYLTKRIPETHRGRVLSVTSSCAGLIGILSNYVIGILIDRYTFSTVWMIIAAIGLFVMILYSIYLKLDKKAYPGLYSK